MSIRKRDNLRRARGFTLIEILVASTIAMAILVLLASVMNHAGEIWSTNDRQSHLREKVRQAADMIKADLRQARLPFNLSESPGLQFVQNPSGLSADYQRRDSLFWQIPARGMESIGDQLAAVGYFVKREGSRFLLCRLYVPASAPNFRVYNDANWIPSMIYDLAPATAEQNYRGLFLENTPGIWIRAYRRNSSGAEERYIPDSRTDRALPDHVEISIAFVDPRGMARLGGDFSADDMAELIQEAGDAIDFVHRLPVRIRKFSGHVTISVPLANRLHTP